MTDLHVLTVGESMACLTPSMGGTVAHSRQLRIGIGGAESNVAIGLSRLGVPAVWVSRLGRDSVGDLVRRELRSEGVELRVTEDPFAPTGLMIKERLGSGHARVAYYRRGSAASLLEPSDIPDALVQEARLVHLTGVTLALSPSAAAAVVSVAQRAREAGVAVSFDVNHRIRLWKDEATARDAYRRIIEMSDIVFASEDEAHLIVGDGAPADVARRLSALGPRTAVVKYGAAGAIGFEGGETLWQDSIPVAAVDTVGAGDAFAAGFLAAHLARAELSQRLLQAAATGALACTEIGDWEGAARPDDVDRLLGRRSDDR